MTDAVRNGEELAFTVHGRKLTGKRWGRTGGVPTFALHGWLDNANSFDRLLPYLPELDVVALDFAGHGHSDHRAAGEHYQSVSDIQDVLAVADELDWPTFGLIGHSMGAAIASELAALFPDKVTSAVMVDGFVATGGVTVEERIEQFREALIKMVAEDARAPKVYPDVDSIAQRVTEATDQSIAAARVLVERGTKAVEGGVTWRTDPRIRYPSPYRHNREYLDALLANSTSSQLLVVAEQGDTWYQGEVERTSQLHPNLQVERMPGPHHIHLEPKFVRRVVDFTRRFLDLPAVPTDKAEQLEWDGPN